MLAIFCHFLWQKVLVVFVGAIITNVTRALMFRRTKRPEKHCLGMFYGFWKYSWTSKLCCFLGKKLIDGGTNRKVLFFRKRNKQKSKVIIQNNYIVA